ncbi:MAG TPA: hypothetical protein VGR47_23055 [Terracidiphilus sp.]|nr:hypothetical protein [Terracidiphilus sp.]
MDAVFLAKAILGFCICIAIPLLLWDIFRKHKVSKVPSNRAMAWWWSITVYLGLVCVWNLPRVLAAGSLLGFVAYSVWPLLFLWCCTRLIRGWRARQRAWLEKREGLPPVLGS